MNRRELIKWFMDNDNKWPNTFMDALFYTKILGGEWMLSIDADGKYYFNSSKHGTFDKATFDKMTQESKTMDKQQAIRWCKDYLPKWPSLSIGTIGVPISYTDLARPLGWSWVFTNERVSLTSSGDYIFEQDVWVSVVEPSKEVKHLLSLIEQVKIREDNDKLVLTKRETFKELSRLPAFSMCDGLNDIEYVHQGVTIRVLSDDINIIYGFIHDHHDCFEEFLKVMKYSRKSYDVLSTLIYSDK